MILSHARLYTTVGLFWLNSSLVSAYTSIAVNPAPSSITVRFPVRAVARPTIQIHSVSTRDVRCIGKKRTFAGGRQLTPFLDFLVVPDRRADHTHWDGADAVAVLVPRGPRLLGERLVE